MKNTGASFDMKAIAIFNNKGGVGKTTFCANLATHLAQKHKKKVLIMDLDPQANITHYMLGEELASQVIAPYYDKNIKQEYSTIVDAFSNYELGESVINSDIKKITCTRFHSDLIAGNPFLASYDDILSKKWNELSDPDNVSGMRITNWIYSILQKNKNDYDYILMDLSPSLGAINRTALLAADYFISPMSCDIFSLVAIKNIRQWFEKWIPFYNTRLKDFKKEKDRVWSIIKNDVKDGISVNEGFIGYTLQSYISRKDANGNIRTTQSYQNIINNFEPEIQSHLVAFKNSMISNNADLNLGEIPHMFGILALSQFVASPIADLNAADGLAGSQYAQARNYMKAFDQISDRIVNNIEGKNNAIK